MNGLLQLKGRFDKRGNEGMGSISLPAHKKVTSEKIEKLISQLAKVKEYWSDKSKCVVLNDCAHFPFFRLNNFDEIMECDTSLCSAG